MYKIERAGKPAEVKRGGVRKEQYPFSQLLINESFFVPKTVAKFATTVRGANVRFEKPTGKQRRNSRGRMVPETVAIRKFVVRNVKIGHIGTNGYTEKKNGCRVYRIK